jgi:hypothetical protein
LYDDICRRSFDVLRCAELVFRKVGILEEKNGFDWEVFACALDFGLILMT